MLSHGAAECDARMFQCRYVLHIIDTDPLSLSANGWLEDTSKVQKYEMSDQAYAERENTYRKFKEQRLKVRGFSFRP